MPSENARSRVRRAIKESFWAMQLSGFSNDNIVVRKQPTSDGLTAPAIVISKSRVVRERSPAGLRVRTIECLVSVYFRTDDKGKPDQEEQEELVEQMMAPFDLPPEMPQSLTSIVPEAQEVRATNRDEFLSTVYPYQADVHRFLVAVEVCQQAGIST